MANWCLIKEKADQFKKALVSGELNPQKLSEIANLPSMERRKFLEKYVGKENAVNVNALFESKLLLKNQKAAMISWAKQVAGLKPAVKQDMIAKIERLQNVLSPAEEQKFFHDLASQRLKIDINVNEAKNLADLSKKAQDLKLKANTDGVFPTKTDRLSYGAAQVQLENFFNDLKLESRKISLRENPKKKIISAIGQTPGVMKSVVASLDNSFFGRQGIKTLYTHPTVWVRSFLKSWPDIAKQTLAKGSPFKSGEDVVMNSIKADIYSRPNALNGKYKAGGYGLNVLSEEAYPSSLPERIPLLGRLFKASEVAYNGAALRMRADLADLLIAKAEKMGINTLDPKEAAGMGHLVGSLTGRGSLQMTEGQSKLANVALFSIKFLKGNFDTLTAHQFDSKASAFVKREAALNLAKIVTTVATVQTIAKILDPNSVDEDPRSSNFGKIKIFGHWTDITGGMSSLITLASKLVPTYHKGELGFWSKSASGIYTNLGTTYGVATPLDVLEKFFEGKLSPVAGILRDIWTRKTYSGQPVTVQSEASNQVPLVWNTFNQLKKDPQSTSVIGSLILDGLGFSVNTNTFQKDWSSNPTKSQQEFQNKVGNDKFNKANDEFNSAYNAWFNKISTTSSYKKLSESGKQSLISKVKESIQTKIFKQYGFKYKAPKKTPGQKNESKTIKTLIPK